MVAEGGRGTSWTDARFCLPDDCTKWYTFVMDITDALEMNGTVDQVWAATVDVESWPTLTPTITSVERLDEGPLRIGSRARIVQPKQRPRVWTVVELEAPHRFAWQTEVGSVTMTGTHDLLATDHGCRNTLAVELSGRGSRLLHLVLGRTFRKAIALENEGFRSLVESQVPASAARAAPDSTLGCLLSS